MSSGLQRPSERLEVILGDGLLPASGVSGGRAAMDWGPSIVGRGRLAAGLSTNMNGKIYFH